MSDESKGSPRADVVRLQREDLRIDSSRAIANPILVHAGLRSMIQRLLMPAEHLSAVRELDRLAAA